MSGRVAVVAGMVAALGVGGGYLAFGSKLTGARKPAFHLDKARVERGDLVGRVTATGTLSALVTVQVGSQVSGRIAQLNADFGARVKKGQVIARLDPRLFEATDEQAHANESAAEADLEKARAQAEDAERKFVRAKELSSKQLIAPAELDSATAVAKAARAAVSSAEGNLALARASRHQARVNLGYTTIVSPINGVVISRNVDVGQTVAASLQAPTLFTIAEDLGKMQVHAAVSEADVGRLAQGMTATFSVDAYPDQKFEGVIRQIRDAPQTLQNVVTYDAVVDVDNPDHRLRPGMTANVTFVYAERKGVLRVPTAALRFRPPEALVGGADGTTPVPVTKPKSKKHRSEAQAATPPAVRGDAVTAPSGKSVWVLHGEGLREVPIEVGVSDGSKIEVTKGALAEGDVVVTDAVDKRERAEAKAKAKGGLF
jgi:HlyD family secretion protein